jgi:hypothetical protein
METKNCLKCDHSKMCDVKTGYDKARANHSRRNMMKPGYESNFIKELYECLSKTCIDYAPVEKGKTPKNPIIG